MGHYTVAHCRISGEVAKRLNKAGLVSSFAITAEMLATFWSKKKLFIPWSYPTELSHVIMDGAPIFPMRLAALSGGLQHKQ